jgi:hypothetical protein
MGDFNKKNKMRFNQKFETAFLIISKSTLTSGVKHVATVVPWIVGDIVQLRGDQFFSLFVVRCGRVDGIARGRHNISENGTITEQPQENP